MLHTVSRHFTVLDMWRETGGQEYCGWICWNPILKKKFLHGLCDVINQLMKARDMKWKHSIYRVVRWNQDKSYFLDKINIKHSFFNQFIWNKKQKVGLCIVFTLDSKKQPSASIMPSTWPWKATHALAIMALSMEAKFSLMEVIREALIVWACWLVCVFK
jgi:hypothetical protein